MGAVTAAMVAARTAPMAAIACGALRSAAAGGPHEVRSYADFAHRLVLIGLILI